MIRGRVTPERQAVVRLQVHGPDGRSEPVETAIDTGFTGFLTLPSDLVAQLALPCLGLRAAILADGRRVVLNHFEVLVEWDGQRRRVSALEVDRGALVGMRLLEGFRMTMDIAEDGPVCIERLSVW